MKAFIERIDRTNPRNVFQRAWKHAEEALKSDGAYELVIRHATKSRDQEEHYHAQIGDIAKQFKHHGRQWELEDMKRLMVDAFKHYTMTTPGHEELAKLWKEVGETRLAPAVGRDGFVYLGEQTRRFPVRLASGFIQWLYAFGYECEPQIVWSDPKFKQAAEAYSQMREQQIREAA